MKSQKPLRVRFSEKDTYVLVSKITKYYEMVDTQFIEMFLPQKYDYEIVSEYDTADICIIGVQHTNNKLLRDDEINILVSMENLGCGRTHYKFHNAFGDTNNEKVNIHIYNHYNRVVYDENNTSIPRILPVVDFRIQFYNKIYNKWREEFNTPFEKKKFCLFASSNGLNQNKHSAFQQLSQLGQVDMITNFKKLLGNKACVHGYDMIKFLNKYKFIICFENSKTPGYITEKIFNVFHARSIPIYDGAPDIDTYVNSKAYIAFNTPFIQKVGMIMNNKELYERILNEKKIISEINTELINNYLDYYLNERYK
jgi:hypothetical protein